MVDGFSDVQISLLFTRFEMQVVSWDARDHPVMVERFIDD
jgi:hypothetical protein